MYSKYTRCGNINPLWIAEQQDRIHNERLQQFAEESFDWAKSNCKTEGDKILAAAIINAVGNNLF